MSSPMKAATGQFERPVEISDLFLRYALDFPIPKEARCRVNFEDLKHTDVDFSRLQMVSKPTCHIPTRESSPLKSGMSNGSVYPKLDNSTNRGKTGFKSHVLFSSVFANNTSEPQTHHLRTERRTNATCRISMQKSVTREGNFGLQISSPGSVVQANGGFRREVQMSHEREKVFEEELVWSLDTEVIVPPGYRTRADLVISEDEYDGRFRLETVFEGTVAIRLRDKRDGSLVYSINVSDLKQVLTTQHGFHELPNQPGAMGFWNEGVCHCHLGIGQNVELHQEKI